MPPIRQIRTQDANFQRLQTLSRNRHKRQHEGEFIVEGVRNLNAAQLHGWHYTSVAYAHDRPLSRWAQAHVEACDAPRWEMPSTLMALLSERDDPSELVATISMRDDLLVLTTLVAAAPALIVVLDRPQNPGNIGTVIRSADALGADAVVVTGHAADIYEPACLRASLGSIFCLPVIRLSSPDALSQWSAAHLDGAHWIGTDSDAEQAIDQVDCRGPVVLVMGNEAGGLSAAWRDRCDLIARIPLAGRAADSLNLASAASIVLYEVQRQRLGSAD